MTFPETIEFLNSLQWRGTKLGLQNSLRLSGLAGNPQHKLSFIHVAGTNGKGSTCAMLESICRAAGLRTGLYTSPHLVAFSERIQVNRQPIPDDDIVRLVQQMMPLLEQFPQDQHPTFFEVVTVLALLYFVEQQCDIVLWETGLGGRLDATNIVTPLASVITNIQFDHQKWLGDTIASIAVEKAGIIKPGVPVITAAAAPEALKVISETARQQEASLTVVAPEAEQQSPLAGIRLPLLGRHQRLNAATAIATLRVLAGNGSLPISDQALADGLSTVYWAGRLQIIERSPGHRLLLDGAHNAAGTRSLVDALTDHFPGQRPVLIMGILRDKDWEEMCVMLSPLARRILAVPVNSERTATPAELRNVCQRFYPDTPVEICHTVTEALDIAENYPFVLVAGSLYLVGEILEHLRIVPAAGEAQRALNEWGQKG
jgi:dihydrofolate synthase/folylpolyglutamate synthase